MEPDTTQDRLMLAAFAMQALLLRDTSPRMAPDQIATEAVKYADAILNQVSVQ